MKTADQGTTEYSMPALAPLFGKPPYEYRNSWIMAIMFRTFPGVLEDLIPKPLLPNPNDTMFILIERLFAVGIGNYHEFMLGAPALFRNERVNYCMFLVVDTDVSMAVGREIWGFPKILGRPQLEENNGIVNGTVERNGVTLVKGTIALREPGKSPEALRPMVCLKLIPSVKKDSPPDVMQLTSTTFANYSYHSVRKGEAVLEFCASPESPFRNIPIKEILDGSYINSAATLTYGEVLYDYLKPR